MTMEVFPDGISVREIQVEIGKGTGSARRVPLQIPQRYYDWSLLLAHFLAPTDAVQTLIPDDRLVPVEYVPGTSVVTLAAFEYRKPATLAPYDEFAIAVPVQFLPAKRVSFVALFRPDESGLGFWVHRLPVTTEESRIAGVNVWGLPKVISEINFKNLGWARRATLIEDGKRVITLQSATGTTRPIAQQFTTFSLLNGELVSARVEALGEFHAWDTPGQAWFELGEHPVADHLRSLKIRNFAIGGLSGQNLKGRLHAPVRAVTR